MNTTAELEPDLVRRTCGGWLAVAPPTARVRIAVTGATYDEAVEKFRCTFGRWMEILDRIAAAQAALEKKNG